MAKPGPVTSQNPAVVREIATLTHEVSVVPERATHQKLTKTVPKEAQEPEETAEETAGNYGPNDEEVV